MPTVLTPHGWVKVAATPRKRTVAVDPAEALKGPLNYLSCRRSPPKVLPGIIHLPPGLTGGVKPSREAYPYDLDASPERLRAQGRVRSDDHHQIQIGGKNRTVSAPVPDVLVVEDEVEEIRPSKHGSSSSSSSSSHSSRHKHRSPSSHSHSHSHHRHDDAASVASGSSGSSCSSCSSTSSAPTVRSHHRHRTSNLAPEPAAAPVRAHHHAPAHPEPQHRHHRHDYHSGSRRSGYYDNYTSTPALPPPPSSASGRSLSYSWYNATTPLNI